MSFAELTICEREHSKADVRRVRIYAPNVLDLASMQSSIDEIELNPRAGLILEDEKGLVVGWLLPGEKLNEIELNRLHATKAHLISLTRPGEVRLPGNRAA